MTPRGERYFRTADQAHLRASTLEGVTSFVILEAPKRNPLDLLETPEFAWIGPKEFFVSRMARAMLAGIKLVEMRK